MSDLAADLIAFIDDELSLDPSFPVELDTELIEEALVDSLGVLQIVRWLQERTGTSIAANSVTLENFATVRAMLRLVEQDS